MGYFNEQSLLAAEEGTSKKLVVRHPRGGVSYYRQRTGQLHRLCEKHASNAADVLTRYGTSRDACEVCAAIAARSK